MAKNVSFSLLWRAAMEWRISLAALHVPSQRPSNSISGGPQSCHFVNWNRQIYALPWTNILTQFLFSEGPSISRTWKDCRQVRPNVSLLFGFREVHQILLPHIKQRHGINHSKQEENWYAEKGSINGGTHRTAALHFSPRKQWKFYRISVNEKQSSSVSPQYTLPLRRCTHGTRV